MLVLVLVIIFQRLNLVLEVVHCVFGFAASLELFAMACVAVKASSSTFDCVMEFVAILACCVCPDSFEIWVFFCWFCLGEFIGILCFSATMSGLFFCHSGCLSSWSGLSFFCLHGPTGFKGWPRGKICQDGWGGGLISGFWLHHGHHSWPKTRHRGYSLLYSNLRTGFVFADGLWHHSWMNCWFLVMNVLSSFM